MLPRQEHSYFYLLFYIPFFFFLFTILELELAFALAIRLDTLSREVSTTITTAHQAKEEASCCAASIPLQETTFK